MDLVENLKYIAENIGVYLNALVVILGALGVIVESINRIIPTKTPDSALSKIGKFIADAGTYVKKLMDFLRIPNNISKEDKSKEEL